MENNDKRPFWAKEYDVLHEREKVIERCLEAKTWGELVRQGLNAVRVYTPKIKYVGYGYLAENGEIYFERSEDAGEIELTEDTPIKNIEFATDEDGYTVATCDLVEE